jgi:hypothetical protein
MNNLVGADGLPMDRDAEVVDMNGRPIETSANAEDSVHAEPEDANPVDPKMSPVQALMFEEQKIHAKLAKIVNEPQLSRGDLAYGVKLLFRAHMLSRTFVGLLLQDMQGLVEQTEGAQFNNFMLGNQVAMILGLMLDKGLVKKEDMDAKWKEVMDKAKADMQASQAGPPAETCNPDTCTTGCCDSCTGACNGGEKEPA